MSKEPVILMEKVSNDIKAKLAVKVREFSKG